MKRQRVVDIVEKALDDYVRTMKGRGFDPTGVKAATLAACAGLDRSVMSNYLQQYRQVQGDDTRYVIACEGYGRDGRWKLMAKPGAHQAAVERNRSTHMKFVARDMATRVTSDLMHEVRPGFEETSISDAEVERVAAFAEAQIAALISFIEAALP